MKSGESTTENSLGTLCKLFYNIQTLFIFIYTDAIVVFTSIITIVIVIIVILAGVSITVHFKRKRSQQHQNEGKIILKSYHYLLYVQHLGIVNKLAISHNPAYDEGKY